MNFNRFLSEPVNTFAPKVNRRGHMLAFHHIPKTAGSSLTRELSLTLPPYKNVHVGPGGYQVEGAKADMMTAAVEGFIAEEPEHRFRSMSGHMRPAHLKMVRDACPHAMFFTVLRDPVARVVSDYRYCTTPKHPPYQDFIAKYPTIEAYLEDPRPQNKMWTIVGGREQVDDAIARVFKRYLFIGLVEDLTMNFEFLTALMGCPKTIATRANVTQASDSNKVEMTDKLRAKIEAANMKDVTFYNAVRDGLAEKRAEMQDFIKARRAEYLSVETDG